MQCKFLFKLVVGSCKGVEIVIIVNVIDFNFFAQFKHLIKYNSCSVNATVTNY